jgi:D-alanine transaminase
MTQASVSAFWNGQLMPLVDVRVSVLDRAYLFGDAAYEVIRVYRGEPWLFSEHERRLARSLAALKIDAAVTDLRGKIRQLLQRDGKTEAGVYIQVSRGEGPRSHVPPTGLRPNELIYLLAVDDQALEEKRKKGFHVGLTPDQRWGRCDVKSINLLGNTLAGADAKAKGFDDALLVDRDGYVTEGTHSSFFAVFADELVTPPLGPGLLPGITRAHLLGLAARSGLRASERRVAALELARADELFFSGTIAEIQPIVKVDGRPVGKGSPGPVTARLTQLFRAEIP